jgi:DNA-3-methyladenine glycosylase I
MPNPKQSTSLTRCPWCERSELEKAYHDTEWGVPVHDDRLLFEMLILEGCQAGLSWTTVLQKRGNYQEVYKNFELGKVAKLTDAYLEKQLQNEGIVRNRLKVFGARTNARAFMAVQKEFNSFDRYLWQFVNGKPLQPNHATIKTVPASTPHSDALSKDLKKRGFTFVGTTIMYAFMQAVGLTNDHITACHRHAAVAKLK